MVKSVSGRRWYVYDQSGRVESTVEYQMMQKDGCVGVELDPGLVKGWASSQGGAGLGKFSGDFFRCDRRR